MEEVINGYMKRRRRGEERRGEERKEGTMATESFVFSSPVDNINIFKHHDQRHLPRSAPFQFFMLAHE
jgi:hypothetical protein